MYCFDPDAGYVAIDSDLCRLATQHLTTPLPPLSSIGRHIAIARALTRRFQFLGSGGVSTERCLYTSPRL